MRVFILSAVVVNGQHSEPVYTLCKAFPVRVVIAISFAGFVTGSLLIYFSL